MDKWEVKIVSGAISVIIHKGVALGHDVVSWLVLWQVFTDESVGLALMDTRCS